MGYDTPAPEGNAARRYALHKTKRCGDGWRRYFATSTAGNSTQKTCFHKRKAK